MQAVLFRIPSTSPSLCNKDTRKLDTAITAADAVLYIQDNSLWCSVSRSVNALPGNSSVNTVQHTPIEEAVFSVDPTDAPIEWLNRDHMICVSCYACPFLS
jgi:hypothetical protein